MKTKQLLVLSLTTIIFTACSNAPTTTQPNTEATPTKAVKVTIETVETDNISYYEDAKGFFATPKKHGNYPGVVMIHEWWGLNDNIKNQAQTLAAQGYNVLAVDLYHGQIATTSADAQKQVAALDQDDAVKNLQAAVSFLHKRGSVKIASLGWCYGGGQSLQLALSGTPLDATVIYYGQLESDPAKLATIKWPVLGIFGDKDAVVSVDSVKKFKESLDTNKITNEIELYPGVGHAFANPSNAGYAPKETADAWEKTLKFLASNLN